MASFATELKLNWDRLCVEQHLPPSWAQELPSGALPENAGLDEVRVLASRDDIACVLVQLAQQGDTLAGRTLLQAMLPRLMSLARRDPRHDLADFVGAAWLRLMTFPSNRRVNQVLVNLCLDCLKLLTRESDRHVREHSARWLSAPETGPYGKPVWETRSDSATASSYVDALLDLAARDGLTSPTAIEVLRLVYRDGLSGRMAAERLGISHDMVRYYCSRAIKALKAHREELLDALGTC